MKRALCLIFLLIAIIVYLPIVTSAQGIKGVIADNQQQPISFAAIYIESLQTGTTANAKGEYEITLPAGTYKVLFRSLGYKQVVKDISVEHSIRLVNVELPVEVYQINEVTVSNSKEDPAYAIMRKAIAWAPYHLNQVKHYDANVYVKGHLDIKNIPFYVPKTVTLGKSKVKFKSGQQVIVESVNEIKFDAPDKYAQTVKSSHSSLPGEAGKVDIVMLSLKSSYYEPNPMGSISPLSPQAFAHYNFVYEGYFEENGQLINKIKVIPRRKSQDLFAGHIYINDQLWNLHSIDLTSNTFMGEVHYNQLFSPIKENAWLPVSNILFVDADAMGIKAQYKYSSSVTYSNIIIDPRRKEPSAIMSAGNATPKESPAVLKKKPSNLDALLSKEKLTYRDVRKIIKAARKEEKQLAADTTKTLEITTPPLFIVDANAGKKDSTYWTQVRAIPLSLDEQTTYHKRDSAIAAIKPEKDSLKAPNNRRPMPKLLLGFSHPYKDSSLFINYKGLLLTKPITFNTVDGWTFRQAISLYYQLDSIHGIFFSPILKYATSRNVFMGAFTSGFLYAPLKMGMISISAGSGSNDFNTSGGISTLKNSINSLLFRENDLKLFENRYVQLTNEIDLANGLRLIGTIGYAQARTLINHSNFSFFYRHQREFTPNIPNNQFYNALNNYSSYSFAASLSYTPKYYYRIDNYRKTMLRSNYPTFSLHYKTALTDLSNQTPLFHLVKAAVKQQIELRNASSLKYNAEVGRFFSVTSLHFSEFKHFSTQPMFVSLSAIDESFQLLNYYRYSTKQQYAEGHIHYQSPFMLLKRLPVISNTSWTENIYFSYLTTPMLKNYIELGYVISNISLMGSLGIFTSFENGDYRSFGAKLSIDIEQMKKK